MMFKAVFLYAVLRGIGDYLARRPDPRGRILNARMVQVSRKLKALARGFYGMGDASRKTGEAFRTVGYALDELKTTEVKVDV